jgi:hypothetical protein
MSVGGRQLPRINKSRSFIGGVKSESRSRDDRELGWRTETDKRTVVSRSPNDGVVEQTTRARHRAPRDSSNGLHSTASGEDVFSTSGRLGCSPDEGLVEKWKRVTAEFERRYLKNGKTTECARVQRDVEVDEDPDHNSNGLTLANGNEANSGEGHGRRVVGSKGRHGIDRKRNDEIAKVVEGVFYAAVSRSATDASEPTSRQNATTDEQMTSLSSRDLRIQTLPSSIRKSRSFAKPRSDTGAVPIRHRKTAAAPFSVSPPGECKWNHATARARSSCSRCGYRIGDEVRCATLSPDVDVGFTAVGGWRTSGDQRAARAELIRRRDVNERYRSRTEVNENLPRRPDALEMTSTPAIIMSTQQTLCMTLLTGSTRQITATRNSTN